MPETEREPAPLRPSWWWGFTLYAVVSLVHVIALAVGADAVASPTKLALMPALAVGVFWAGRGSTWGPRYTLLFVAVALSWLGDAAGTLFPFAPTVPMMLLFFGLAHLAYIWLFARHIAVRPMPPWAAVYALWWVVLLAVLWPSLGGLTIAVAVYGLVLGATAAFSTRCHPAVAWGGALFLTSDSLLAFLLFMPTAMPAIGPVASGGAPGWLDPAIMLTYCAGQGLIAVGAVVTRRRFADATASRTAPEPSA